jgi:nucleotide-binding universal stress UspA family protein
MAEAKPILVTVDFSRCSGDALRQGVRMAGWSGAPVRVLHVVDVPLMDPMTPPLLPVALPTIDVLVKDAGRRWEEFARDCPGKAQARFEVRVGSPRAQILDFVHALVPELLVMGVFGPAGAGGGMGSVAAGCVRKAECDVLLVREGAAGVFRRVAACIDFSEGSRAALDRAIRVAAQDGAALSIVHVYEDPWRGLEAPGVIRQNMPEFRATLSRAVEARMREFCAPFSHEVGGLKAEFHAVQSDPKWGSFGRGVARFMADHGIDLGVLATRSNWTLRDMLVGSTAERILRDAPCSLLAVKPAAMAGSTGGARGR